MYAAPPITSGRVTLREGLVPCGPTGLRRWRAARCPGSYGTSQRDEASKRTEAPPRSRCPATGLGWEVAYSAGRRVTDMSGAFDGVILGLNTYPPDIRESARWQN